MAEKKQNKSSIVQNKSVLDVLDGMVSVSNMKEYGYLWDRMLLMGKERAL